MSARRPLRNGKPASTAGGPRSKEFREPSKALQKLLASVYNRYQRLDDRMANVQARQDFIFHMTDWLDDLDRLKAIYDHPEQFDRREAAGEIFSFLIHVIPHLSAAGRLLLDEISDPFKEVGTTR